MQILEKYLPQTLPVAASVVRRDHVTEHFVSQRQSASYPKEIALGHAATE
eukprot:CAMPEP_0198716020 /NCGR_PEP_ID=MMETSP1471-20131121/35416_1 /TAXON_ID=41880 /ORGANISM="Pycnococcus provasolii, Strain RCC733" /LENGTH=49 /DNA_ID= /DNA_START= /DNA_END= /DNA_ORIENTATION=